VALLLQSPTRRLRAPSLDEAAKAALIRVKKNPELLEKVQVQAHCVTCLIHVFRVPHHVCMLCCFVCVAVQAMRMTLTRGALASKNFLVPDDA
jgi:hypothetical protein